MRGVEVKHLRGKDVDLEKVWDVESATGKGVLYRSLRSAHSAAASEPANTVTPERLQDLLRRSSMR
jgi:hypothetical protein